MLLPGEEMTITISMLVEIHHVEQMYDNVKVIFL